MATQTKTISSEQLEPEIDKQIKGAIDALQYFKNMKACMEAVGHLVDAQLEYAEEMLKQLEDEKQRKYS